jgi:hypothetical protein
MTERAYRIEALRLTSAQIAALLEVPEDRLGRWMVDGLTTEEADVIEVGMSLLESVRLAPRPCPELAELVE